MLVSVKNFNTVLGVVVFFPFFYQCVKSGVGGGHLHVQSLLFFICLHCCSRFTFVFLDLTVIISAFFWQNNNLWRSASVA